MDIEKIIIIWGKLMKIKEYISRLCMQTGLIFMLLFTTNTHANTEFHDVASTVMMNSLQTQPKNSFLRKLYTQLLFVPIWVKEDSLSPLSGELLVLIKNDKTLLESSKLHQDAMLLDQKAKEIYSNSGTLYQKVDLEFKLSQLYKGYADYTLYGSINWGAFQDRLHNIKAEDISAGWVTHKPDISPLQLVERAVFGEHLEKLFAQAGPKEYRYKELKSTLIAYLELKNKGGWAYVPLEGILRVGKSSKHIPALRERLRVTGEYRSCYAEETALYDECLKEAVIRFQARHGLVAKGTIGPNTMKALNVPIEKRISQIRLNLDRIKWLNERHANRHIMINIPAFTLFFEEGNALRQQMKVITGTRKNPTPIFSDTVEIIVLNPYWNVPKSIIQKEMIPELLKNPDAMKKQGIEIRNGWHKDAEIVSPYSVDWAQYRYSKSMPFRFAQLPGYKNALGKVKFLFPNKFSVYMHDTPGKHLFNKNVRAFSHGCIRLSQPRELLRTFSTFNESVDFEKSQKRLKGKKKAYLKLDSQVPVDVIYLTSYVDYEGVLQFRNDIYGYDKMQLQAFRKW